MMKVEFKESFAKDLGNVKEKSVLKSVEEIIGRIENAGSLSEVQNLKKLKGGGNFFRVRIGDYRLGIAVKNNTVFFVRFLNRKEIYRYFP
jgi:mRNA interferase RelE/StbE